MKYKQKYLRVATVLILAVACIVAIPLGTAAQNLDGTPPPMTLPNLKPERVWVSERGENEITVNWNEPSHPMVQDTIHNSYLWGLQYSVKYRQYSHDGTGDWIVSGTCWMESECQTDIIADLSPDTRYEVKVVVLIEHYGDEFNSFEFASDSVAGRTLPLTEEIAVRNLNAVNKGKRIRITWRKPLHASDLDIIGYAVQFVKQSDAESRPSPQSPEWTDVCDAERMLCHASTRKKTIFNVEKNPQVEYFIRVAPVTSTGPGKWSYYPRSKRHGLVAK